MGSLYFYSDAREYVPHHAVYEDFEDTTYNVTLEGDWERVAHAGIGLDGYAYASRVMAHGETSELTITHAFPSEGHIVFAYSMESEAGLDVLQFYIDGVETATKSGYVEQERLSYAVSAGTHTFTWRYTKNGSTSVGADRVYIDRIALWNGKRGRRHVVFI